MSASDKVILLACAAVLLAAVVAMWVAVWRVTRAEDGDS